MGPGLLEVVVVDGDVVDEVVVEVVVVEVVVVLVLVGVVLVVVVVLLVVVGELVVEVLVVVFVVVVVLGKKMKYPAAAIRTITTTTVTTRPVPIPVFLCSVFMPFDFLKGADRVVDLRLSNALSRRIRRIEALPGHRRGNIDHGGGGELGTTFC